MPFVLSTMEFMDWGFPANVRKQSPVPQGRKLPGVDAAGS